MSNVTARKETEKANGKNGRPMTTEEISAVLAGVKVGSRVRITYGPAGMFTTWEVVCSTLSGKGTLCVDGGLIEIKGSNCYFNENNGRCNLVTCITDREKEAKARRSLQDESLLKATA